MKKKIAIVGAVTATVGAVSALAYKNKEKIKEKTINLKEKVKHVDKGEVDIQKED